MNIDYLEKAKERIPNIPLLINLVSKRVRQLNNGQRPLTKRDNPKMSNSDVALKEIAEGKLTGEMTFVKLDDPIQESIGEVISMDV